MGPATRGLLHWLSALIALPAIAYAGRPFFASAWAALRRGGTNMDVPVSIGVLLVSGLSLWQTAAGGAQTYFESATMLLFFLLVGRLLDHRARGRARAAAEDLLTWRSVEVTRAPPRRQHRPPRPEPTSSPATSCWSASASASASTAWSSAAGRCSTPASSRAKACRRTAGPGPCGVCRHAEPRRRAHRPGDRGRRANHAGRMRAADRGRRSAARPDRRAGGPGRARLCARRARLRAGDVPGLDARAGTRRSPTRCWPRPRC